MSRLRRQIVVVLLLVPSLLTLFQLRLVDASLLSSHRKVLQVLQRNDTTDSSTTAPTSGDPSPSDPAYVNGTTVSTLEIGIVQQECIITFKSYFNPYGQGNTELVAPQNNIQQRAENCCASCHSNNDCNAWQWCPSPNGCTIPSILASTTIPTDSNNNTSTTFNSQYPAKLFPHLGCQLMNIGSFSPTTQNITKIRTTGDDVDFVAGTPFGLGVARIDGYELDLGSDLNGAFDYPCPKSSLAYACVVEGDAATIATACTGDALCMAFTYYPLGVENINETKEEAGTRGVNKGSPIGFLKHRKDGVITDNFTQLNPNAAVYIKLDSLAQPLVTKAVEQEQNKAHTVVLAVSLSATAVLLLAIVAAFIYRQRYKRMIKTYSSPATSPQQSVGGTTPHDNNSPASSLGLEQQQLQQLQQQQQQSQPSMLLLPPSSMRSTSMHHSNSGGNVSSRSRSHPALLLDQQQPSGTVNGGVVNGGQGGEGLVSPFMFLDEAAIAAMMAAAPQVAAIPSSSGIIFTQGKDQSSDYIDSSTSSSLQNLPPPFDGHTAPRASTARELLSTYSQLYHSRTPVVDPEQLELALNEGILDGGEGPGVPVASTSGTTTSTSTSTTSFNNGSKTAASSSIPNSTVNFSSSTTTTTSTKPPLPPSSTTTTLTIPPNIAIDWLIQPEEVQICRRPDGDWWRLGTGAYGTVYKALLRNTHPVAVKLLHRIEDARHVKDFQNEISLLRSLDHRHVVRFLGACLETSSGMLVTELMELGDLWSVLPVVNKNKERIFAWYARGWRVILDVAKGLDFLHSRRIMHMDLKSANILLTRTGVAKIADVGMAKTLTKSYFSMLSGGVGTFAWSAPEVLTNKRCDTKSDIFSLGVVMWEVCTGEAPVRGHMRPLVAPTDCPVEVIELYERCTAENAEDRPTAAEIVGILEKLNPSLTSSTDGNGSGGVVGEGGSINKRSLSAKFFKRR